MALVRTALGGRRGLLAVASATLALTATVAAQAHASVAHADLVAATTTASPSPTVTDTPDDPAPTPSPSRPPTTSPATSPATAQVAPPAPRAPVAPHAAPVADACSAADLPAARGRLALASLRDTGQRSGVSVSFLPARSGYLGLTYPERHHVDVFVRSCDAESTSLLRHVVSHEMGHAFDAAHMTPARRAAYLAMRGIPAGTPWFGCSYCTDFATPAGDFAETYSQWQRGTHDSRTRIAAMPTDGQLADIAAAFFQG